MTAVAEANKNTGEICKKFRKSLCKLAEESPEGFKLPSSGLTL
jgi:hypothetical protein